MEVKVSIKCTCSKYFKEILPAPYPNFMADSARDSSLEEWDQVYCPECGKEIDVQIVNSMYGMDVNIDDVEYFDFEEVHTPETEEEVAWIFEIGSHYAIYELSMINLRAMTNLSVSDPQRITLHTMIHSQMIASLEAYLSSTFIKAVLNDEELSKKLVESDKDIGNQSFSLKDIYTEMENIKNRIALRLQDITFHNVKKVKPLYKNVLGVDFGDISWLGKAVSIRHDCTHRNGYDKDGNLQKISSSTLVDLANSCDSLVSVIEDRIVELDGSEF